MSTQYQGATTDTRFDPVGSLLQYVEGKAWTVDYFQQMLGKSDETSSQQTNLSAPFQQYRRIRRMELKVNQALTPAQDDKTKQFLADGESTTFPRFIPNAGDMFLADIGDGREGVFTVVSSKKMTHLKEAQYQIRYELRGYSDTLGSTLADLSSKTIQTFHFIKDYLTFGESPLLMDKKYSALMDLNRLRDELVDYYFDEMFSIERQTLLLRNQQLETYDPYVPRFVVDLVGSEEHPNVGRIRHPTVDGLLVTRHPNIWTALKECNPRLVRNLVHRVRLLDTAWLRHQPLVSGVYWAGIKRIVFPFNVRVDVDGDYAVASCVPPPVANILIQAGKNRWSSLERLLSNQDIVGLEEKDVREGETPVGIRALPDYVRVTADDYYVFSEKFYRQYKPSSKLEALVIQYLNQEEIDVEILLEIAKVSVLWPNLERFYYLPVLMMLITAAMRRN